MSVPATSEQLTAQSVRQFTSALNAYRGEQIKSNEDQRIVAYLPLVHKIVHQVIGYLRPPISKEDLVSAGTVGLVKASRDFDPAKEAEFKTYAYIRIRGAVIDELRQWSFTPPNVGKSISCIEQICHDSIEKTGTAPSDEFIAEAMGISLEKLYNIFESTRASHFLSIHGLSDNSAPLANLLVASEDPPESNLEQQEMVEQLTIAIQSLPPKQRQLIILYYNQQLTMKQIAQVLELTESRVSQLHASALVKLSAQLGAYHGV
jgi:RNA polymerase sigma factor FliA